MMLAYLQTLAVVLVAAGDPNATPDTTFHGQLLRGAPVEEPLETGSVHAWSVELERGQYAEVEVEQLGIDVVLRVIDPAARTAQEFDSPTGPWGPEHARWIAGQTGKWTLAVERFASPAESRRNGSVRIQWLSAREASESDYMRLKADSLSSAAKPLMRAGDMGAAAPFFEQALALEKQASGPEHPAVAERIQDLAWCYDYGYLREVATVDSLYRRALSIHESSLRAGDPRIATSLAYLGNFYNYLGRYDDAEAHLLRAIEIGQKTKGYVQLQLANNLNLLGSLYYNQGRYRESEQVLEAALEIDEEWLGADALAVGQILDNIGVIHEKTGRYREAEPLFERAIALEEGALGPDHLVVAEAVDHFAVLKAVEGSFAEAEMLQHRALRIWEQSLGPDHPRVATSLNNLAVLYDEQGRSDEAVALHRRALTIREREFGPDHHLVAASLHSLGGLYRDQDRWAEAEDLFDRALGIREKVLGPDHSSVASSLHSLAVLYDEQRRDSAAMQYYKRALSIREKAFGSNHPLVAHSLLNLAGFFLDRDVPGRIDSVFAVINRAIEILDETGGSPIDRVEAYAVRAEFHKRRGDATAAINDLDEAIAVVEEMRPQVGGAEELRAVFFDQYAKLYDRMVGWQLEAGEAERAFEYAERGRARALLDQLAAGKVDLRAAIPEDVLLQLETREAVAKARLAEYGQRITFLRSRDDLDEHEREARLSALTDSLTAADRDFRQVYGDTKTASPLWRDLITSGSRPVKARDVHRRLVPSGGLLLLYQLSPETSYVFVAGKSRGDLKVFPLTVPEDMAVSLKVESGPLTRKGLLRILGTAQEETANDSPDLVSQLSRSRVGRGSRIAAGDRLHALWQVLVPQGIRQRLLDATEVVIVPDGALHRLPFEALVVEQGEGWSDTTFWLDVGPAVRYAPSATVLYNLEQRPASRVLPKVGQSFLVTLADPVFDTEEVEQARQGHAYAQSEQSVEQVTGRAYVRAGGSLARLPGTAEESDEILAAFAFDASRGATVLYRLDATERNLRAAVAGKRYVHLATHGLVSEAGGSLFAGLAMTPAGDEVVALDDDGYLDLHEIYDLPLEETELAVLSACETNVGQQVESEGVFALSRGFLAAGARRIVASQWAVDDASTAVLMGAFFGEIAAADRAAEPIDYAIALRNARRQVRGQPQWADPFHWAPFVLTGKR